MASAELASILGIALSMDDGHDPGAEPLRALGIEGRPASAYIATQVRETTRASRRVSRSEPLDDSGPSVIG